MGGSRWRVKWSCSMEVIENELISNNDFLTDNNSKKLDDYVTIVCPYCNKEVKLINYGRGWVGSCCNRIVYNSQKLPGK
jgi:hypothetical protein